MTKCYNGAWDSKTRARLDQEIALLQEIRAKEPEAHCTYFPAEKRYQVRKWGNPIGPMKCTRLAALNAARSNFGGK